MTTAPVPVPDPIDSAIAASEPQTETVEVIQTQMQLPPRGRPAILAIPRDITLEEAFHLMTAVSTIVTQVRASNPVSRLVAPNGAPLG